VQRHRFRINEQINNIGGSMKNIIYILIVVLLLAVLPVIPHEREIQHGIVVIEQETVAEYLYNIYQQTQERQRNVNSPKRPSE
jgi:hypothetical protein